MSIKLEKKKLQKQLFFKIVISVLTTVDKKLTKEGNQTTKISSYLTVLIYHLTHYLFILELGMTKFTLI